MENVEKVNLLELDLASMETFLLELGMKKFNGKQVYKWLHSKIARKFDEMTDISIPNRALLAEKSFIPFLEVLKHQVSKVDNTEKYLFELSDKHTIETVLIKHKERNTICVSSQIGCPVKCIFCATGTGGFVRNLTVSEILNQVYTVQRRLSKTGVNITNVVFMGMGEPMLNLDNVLAAVDVLSSENGMNISKRRITISTSGIIPGIERILRERIPVELAVSLHSVFDNVRSEMIPINKAYPLQDLMDVLTEYQMVTKRRISFEYALINEYNSSIKDAEALADFVINFDHVINLIPYNPVEGSVLTRPHPEKIKRFYSYLKDQRKLNVTIRVEKGSDIAGACGQLKEKHRS